MVTAEQNRSWTETGKGTRMGELLRRYWHPVAAVGELDEHPVKPVRLLGEDLVLYRGNDGGYGLLERHCPHRRADLSYGFVDDCGLRCSYHGWAFDPEGTCTSAPFEDVTGNHRLRERVRQVAYPVQAMAGLLFAYLGPQPAPLLPNWELFGYEDGFRQIVIAPVACNWLQCAENDIDPVHFEWLHDNWSYVQVGRGDRAPKHLKIQIDEWEHGYAYRRIVEGSDETSPFWRQPRLHLMPNLFMPGGTHFEYRVPVDDENTLSIVWSYESVPADCRPFHQDEIPHWYAQLTDPATGRWITTHVINQDTVAWVGQGRISDRENEHLGASDRGVVMFRRRLAEDMEKVARGEDPTGVLRDPERNRVVRWPDDRRSEVTKALSREEWLARKARFNRIAGLRDPNDHFIFYAGQPEHVRKRYEAAMGL